MAGGLALLAMGACDGATSSEEWNGAAPEGAALNVVAAADAVWFVQDSLLKELRVLEQEGHFAAADPALAAWITEGRSRAAPVGRVLQEALAAVPTRDAIPEPTRTAVAASRAMLMTWPLLEAVARCRLDELPCDIGNRRGAFSALVLETRSGYRGQEWYETARRTLHGAAFEHGVAWPFTPGLHSPYDGAGAKGILASTPVARDPSSPDPPQAPGPPPPRVPEPGPPPPPYQPPRADDVGDVRRILDRAVDILSRLPFLLQQGDFRQGVLEIDMALAELPQHSGRAAVDREAAEIRRRLLDVREQFVTTCQGEARYRAMTGGAPLRCPQ